MTTEIRVKSSFYGYRTLVLSCDFCVSSRKK